MYRYADVEASLNMNAKIGTPHCTICIIIIIPDSLSAVEKALAGGTQSAREWLVKRCTETLRVYRYSIQDDTFVLINCRAFVSSQAKSTQQLVLPETLKLLPIYTLGLIKHRGFRAGIFVTTDGIEHGIDESVNGNLERSYVLRAMSVMSTEHIVPFCYPRMYQAWPYPDEVCLLMDPETSC